MSNRSSNVAFATNSLIAATNHRQPNQPYSQRTMKNQTAVEYLVEQLEEHYTNIDIKNTVVYQQAKEMEKEQIIETFNEGALDGLELGEQYYTYTFTEQPEQ